MVSLSVFAGPAQILRRFSVFAEEPRKSNITTTEPCNPVFKEVQPRPSQSVIQFSQSNSSFHAVQFVVLMFLLLLCCNKVSSWIVLTSKDLVSSSG